MIKIPVLAVLPGGGGTILDLESEVCKEGKGRLFFDSRLLLDETARTALKTAFSSLLLPKTDILVRLVGGKGFLPVQRQLRPSHISGNVCRRPWPGI